jgi:hypothetical protein
MPLNQGFGTMARAKKSSVTSKPLPTMTLRQLAKLLAAMNLPDEEPHMNCPRAVVYAFLDGFAALVAAERTKPAKKRRSVALGAVSARHASLPV